MRLVSAAHGAALLSTVLLVVGCPGPADSTWEPAFEAEDVGWLLNVGGAAPDDLYAVGGAFDGDGAMMRYDGTGWSNVELPAGTPLLNWVHAFSSTDVFAVGNGGTVLRYDGTWTTMDTGGVDRNLWGVWGANPNDVWAVGGNGSMEGQATLLHYDGIEWTSVDAPVLERERVWAWFKVWGTASNDVWMVGQRGAILHWDGSELTEFLAGTTEDLISVWGTSSDNAVAVGGRGNGVVARWDGTRWSSQSLAPLPGLNGIWMRDPNTAHVVGVNGTSATIDLPTLEYTEADPGTLLALHAVFAVGSSPLIAVGGSLSSTSPPYRGVAVQRRLRSSE